MERFTHKDVLYLRIFTYRDTCAPINGQCGYAFEISTPIAGVEAIGTADDFSTCFAMMYEAWQKQRVATPHGG